jgi:hypothetical protein
MRPMNTKRHRNARLPAEQSGPVGGARAGQAIVEFIVALVVVLVLFAGVLQIGQLGLAHTRTLTEARRKAAVEAMGAMPTLAGPDYIRDVTVGPDGRAYSRDDEHTGGDVGAFQDRIVRYGHPDELDLRVAGNRVTALSRSAMPRQGFGLVRGEGEEVVPLLPAVQNLIYRQKEIELKGEAWLTWLGGIY